MQLLIRLKFAAALALTLTACETTQNPIGTNGCCVMFDTLKPSRNDTQKTIDWMIEHNAVYEGLC